MTVLKEIYLYVSFLLVLFLMGYGNINPASFFIQQSVRGTFLRAEHNGNLGFDGVSVLYHVYSKQSRLENGIPNALELSITIQRKLNLYFSSLAYIRGTNSD